MGHVWDDVRHESAAQVHAGLAERDDADAGLPARGRVARRLPTGAPPVPPLGALGWPRSPALGQARGGMLMSPCVVHHMKACDHATACEGQHGLPQPRAAEPIYTRNGTRQSHSAISSFLTEAACCAARSGVWGRRSGCARCSAPRRWAGMGCPRWPRSRSSWGPTARRAPSASRRVDASQCTTCILKFRRGPLVVSVTVCYGRPGLCASHLAALGAQLV